MKELLRKTTPKHNLNQNVEKVTEHVLAKLNASAALNRPSWQ